jgi:CubicO group peptidase (beta-lactamase class C family)
MNVARSSRLAALVATVIAVVAIQALGQTAPAKVPVSGDAGPGLEELDRAVLRVMQERHIPGASLAVAKDGALVLARGYGWADVAAREPVRPQTLFALGSVSKSITAATILKLADSGRLDLDARAFDLLSGLEPLPCEKIDPRLKSITVRQLLIHAGGWERRKSGDPNGFSQRVAAKMRVPLPVSPRQLTRYMLGRPLDFDPGTQSQYSNFGYIVLGLVIEKVTGRRYEESVRAITLSPMKLGRVVLNHERGKGYRRGEAHRYGPSGVEDKEGGHLPITMASGGWLAAPSDMVLFLTALDGTRGSRFLSERMSQAMTAVPAAPIKPRPNGSHPGLGWDQVRPTPQGVSYQKNGGLLGVRAFLKHNADGTDWAFCFNGGAGGEDGGPSGVLPVAVKAIEGAMQIIKKWPSIDLFEHPPYGRGS